MLTLYNSQGQIDLSVMEPGEIAKLDDASQALLSVLIASVQDREKAQERYSSAVKAVHEATQEQNAALAAHVTASDPWPFVIPDAVAQITDTAARTAALIALKKQHDDRVRVHREAIARKASIESFNATNH